MDGGCKRARMRDNSSCSSLEGTARLEEGDMLSMETSVSRVEGPAICDWSSSWTMSSEMWARIWFLWAIAGRLIITWAFVIRRPEHGQWDVWTNEELERERNTPSDGPFRLAFADLSYPRRKRMPAKGKRVQQDMATKDLTFRFWWLLSPWKEVGLLSESLWESSSYATSPEKGISR